MTAVKFPAHISSVLPGLITLLQGLMSFSAKVVQLNVNLTAFLLLAAQCFMHVAAHSLKVLLNQLRLTPFMVKDVLFLAHITTRSLKVLLNYIRYPALIVIVVQLVAHLTAHAVKVVQLLPRFNNTFDKSAEKK